MEFDDHDEQTLMVAECNALIEGPFCDEIKEIQELVTWTFSSAWKFWNIVKGAMSSRKSTFIWPITNPGSCQVAQTVVLGHILKNSEVKFYQLSLFVC